MHLSRFKPHGLSHSGVITLIAVFENYASAMMSLIVPLYLYAFFKSELIIGQINTFGSFFILLGVVMLGFLLTHFSRALLYKVGVALCILSVVIFFVLSQVTDAYLSRSLFFLANAVTPAILSLYIRDLTTTRALPHTQGLYSATVNLAWLTGPILAGYLVNFFTAQQTVLTNQFTFLKLLDPTYFGYTIPLIFAILLYFCAIIVFSWQKFVVKHPHLQETAVAAENDKAHHHRQLANWRAFFLDSFRVQSFINFTFMSAWWVIAFTYFPILLEKHGLSAGTIGILLGLVTLPNSIFERFIDKVITKTGGSKNALLLGYGLFFGFLMLAALVGPAHILLFAGLLITSQIGVAITEPLQELQFFEGTTPQNQNQFYALHWLGGRIFTFITPALFGFLIATFGIDRAFTWLPLMFLPLFAALFYVRFRSQQVKI